MPRAPGSALRQHGECAEEPQLGPSAVGQGGLRDADLLHHVILDPDYRRTPWVDPAALSQVVPELSCSLVVTALDNVSTVK